MPVGLLLAASAAHEAKLQVVDQDGTPQKFSAHSSQELCFLVVTSIHEFEAVVAVTFEGPNGDLGTKPDIAGDMQPVCVTAPAIPDAGRWRGCTPPPDTIPEAYMVSAVYDRTGAGAEEMAEGVTLEPDDFVWRVERQVTEKDPEPDECKKVEGEWTWTFGAGRLECANLPMKLTLPGFADTVAITTDGEGLEGLNMRIQGKAAQERVNLVRAGNQRRGGRDVPAWSGYRDVSSLLDQGGEVRGKYELVVLSERSLEGTLTVDKARIQDDVCSIHWPFEVTR
ncbi:MAG: hypothetical protein AAGC60_21010 [Acidobacteriota bacterium]